MASVLTLGVAQNLAAALCTIGHPYHPAIINATALDLMKWCKGAIIENCVWTAEQQAEWLVEEVRTTWDSWPEGATKKLLDIFRGKFKAKEQDRPPLNYEEMIERGLIRRPCERCDGGGYVGQAPNIEFCSCGSGRHQQHWEGERGLARINAAVFEPGKATRAGLRPVADFEPLTPETMIQALEDERRRKQEQLRKLEDPTEGIQ